MPDSTNAAAASAASLFSCSIRASTVPQDGPGPHRSQLRRATGITARSSNVGMAELQWHPVGDVGSEQSFGRCLHHRHRHRTRVEAERLGHRPGSECTAEGDQADLLATGPVRPDRSGQRRILSVQRRQGDRPDPEQGGPGSGRTDRVDRRREDHETATVGCAQAAAGRSTADETECGHRAPEPRAQVPPPRR